MAEAVTAGATPLLPSLPDEIVVWEILIRLPPKSVLRCRPVCRAWRRVTSTLDFLLAHHGRQPSLPVVYGYEKAGRNYRNILAVDHQAADTQVQHVARFDSAKLICVEASCDGLLILSILGLTSCRFSLTTRCFSVCNPATRQHALLPHPPDFSLFSVFGMYLHRPSGEYRLLLYRRSNGVSYLRHLLPEGKVGCYVLALGSGQPPRYIGGPEAASALQFYTPVLVRDSLHWSPVCIVPVLLVVFDTTAESFREMRVPTVPTNYSSIVQMDGTLGVCSCNDAMKVVDIWVLKDYQGEIWEHKCRIKLPVEEIRGQFGRWEDHWCVAVDSVDGDILLLLSSGQWLFYVDSDGKLVDSFHCGGQKLSACEVRLKQTLVPHTFFTALEDYAVSASPFI
ncbi:hypothetical protein ACQ4PT_060196 [Festuca glaucescens]